MNIQYITFLTDDYFLYVHVIFSLLAFLFVCCFLWPETNSWNILCILFTVMENVLLLNNYYDKTDNFVMWIQISYQICVFFKHQTYFRFILIYSSSLCLNVLFVVMLTVYSCWLVSVYQYCDFFHNRPFHSFTRMFKSI